MSLRRTKSTVASCTGRGDLAASVTMIFPVFFVYEVGVVFVGRVNGADVVTRALYAALGGRTGYVIAHTAIAAIFLTWIWRDRRSNALRFEIVAPVVGEAAIYALTLGTVVAPLLRNGLGLAIGGNTLISACGAGVHEELVFRLGLCSAMVMAFRGAATRATVVAFAFLVSSLLFAAAHHVGSDGEPFALPTFAFRTIAGMVFAAVFWFRSLAHAVYAHTLYDLVVAFR